MKSSRIQEIDAVRGFAIIGILFVNIKSFSWPELYDSFPSYLWNTQIDNIIQWLQYILIESSFYPLFALLFGLGMGFMYKSVLKKGLNPNIIFFRRFSFLLIIGAVHALFIWHGDILMTYAILGFISIPLLKLDMRKLTQIGTTIYLIPNLLYAGYLYFFGFKRVSSANETLIHTSINNYTDNYLTFLLQNLTDLIIKYPIMNILFVFISIFPLFMLGLALSKSNLLYTLIRNSTNVKRIWMLSGLLGFSIKCLPLLNNTLLNWHLSESFGGPILSVFYGFSTIWLCSKLKHLFSILSVLGRMSMTNYLMQSVIGFIVFKGFKLYGAVSPSLSMLIALVIILFQMVISHFWMAKHSQGPLERIWRIITYGKENILN